jgi:hypothetical protein
MLLILFIPANLVFQERIPLCIFKHLTGIECPLCGMTRACYCIMHLHLASAFSYNPVSLMLPVLVVTEAGYDMAPSVSLKRLRKAIWLIFFAGLTALFLIRIISSFPAR